MIVLSNNDGCDVARSNEAKALGIAMGAHFFQIKSIVKGNGVRVFSSNYPLYGDMSNRVMQTLAPFTPAMEIYSIDEAFLDLTNFVFTDLVDYAQKMRNTVKKIPAFLYPLALHPPKPLQKLPTELPKNQPKPMVCWI
ncbi:UmuC2 [Desulforapulum autotrophicum HRM2]|uniref:UmuC2 n=1 Tax=Desulforapulum autotrophicum (strain ATCC 43914 / DSM 3382 / VKM B-1955 / HRM2) TaxID=177437 RepID=C0QGN2_DESAH|nr:UmuC2 [Desulforapulum autotrophicum HRM2]